MPDQLRTGYRTSAPTLLRAGFSRTFQILLLQQFYNVSEDCQRGRPAPHATVAPTGDTPHLAPLTIPSHANHISRPNTPQIRHGQSACLSTHCCHNSGKSESSGTGPRCLGAYQITDSLYASRRHIGHQVRTRASTDEPAALELLPQTLAHEAIQHSRVNAIIRIDGGELAKAGSVGANPAGLGDQRGT